MSVAALTDESNEDGHDPHYKISGQGEANWALGKVRYFNRRIAENEQLYRDELERLAEWRKNVNTSLESDALYFESLLTHWHEEVFNEDEKRKSIKLPNGVLKSIQTQDKPVVVDKEAFMAEAPEELVRVKYEPDQSAIKEHIKTTGEIPAGVQIEKGERKYSVEVS